jgi:hypothetical protein
MKKSDKNRIQLSHQELTKSLREQLNMLSKSCREFDHGDVLESKRIAVHLRTLWPHTKRSKGLLSQLNLVQEAFDSSFKVPPTFITSGLSSPPSNERRLFAVGGGRNYVPLFDFGPSGIHKIPFNTWWEGHVISDGEGHIFTRRDIVLSVADTDGGAHVDSSLDPDYYALTRKGTFGIIRVVPTEDPKVFKKIETPSPVAVTLRQIGHETLKTLIPGYAYDGRIFYPGPSICYMSAVIVPKSDSEED